jgi:hypothetical protein
MPGHWGALDVRGGRRSEREGERGRWAEPAKERERSESEKKEREAGLVLGPPHHHHAVRDPI